MQKEKIIVVGNGMVGHRFCEEIARLGRGRFDITVFGEENRPAYDRVHLTELFAGKVARDLQLPSSSWYFENGIRLHSAEKINSIDPKKHSVIDSMGQAHIWDHLILATGSSPLVPPISGIDNFRVLTYRSIEDVEEILKMAEGAKRAAVLGGGLLGLEAAKALLDLNLETHVLEASPRLMPRQVDEEGGIILQEKIGDLGVRLHLSCLTKEITQRGKELHLDLGESDSLDVDFLVVSAGIRARDELARNAGLALGERGGVVVGDKLETSADSIYAIGECASHKGMIYGMVAPGYRMARALAKNLVGASESFCGADMSSKLKLLGVNVGSIGNPFHTENVEEVKVCNHSRGLYKKLVVDKNSRRLIGAVLLGDVEEYGLLYQYYNSGKALPENPEALLITPIEGARSENDPQICSCENVKKSAIVKAVGEGYQSVGELKKCTRAGTGCGSCVPLLKDILDDELGRKGLAADKGLCVHFDYSRPELFAIVRREKIRSFNELLGRFGQGGGCAICKPAVASILASLWNDFVLGEDRAVLQETNDRFLANIQKNGSYSIVPRIPGGEILPKHLIILGEVAEDFGLYTKITGGQRIDLFGAHLEDLPSIWKRLIDSGLESGHAYAKSLRTVKSCVGKAWCRFGVQDSTSMAIRIENRYKGLRSPHKIKMAVSGCARECAEARSKDVGIIATEKGWNLYVCGNGGMTPRHADLFAVDLDSEELIRTIDRFLMYYIHTADRLMRTSVWLEKMSGGLEHLQDVVLNDSLKIGTELESDMERTIGSYRCEWKATLEDPEALKHFRTFADTDKKDWNIRVEKIRGQRQPLLLEES